MLYACCTGKEWFVYSKHTNTRVYINKQQHLQRFTISLFTLFYCIDCVPLYVEYIGLCVGGCVECMCVLYIHGCMCVYLYTGTCMYYMHICMHGCIYICMCTRTNICMYEYCMYRCMHWYSTCTNLFILFFSIGTHLIYKHVHF